MKRHFLLITAMLFISISGFSQITEKEFLQNRNSQKDPIWKHNFQSFKDVDFQTQDLYLQSLTKKRETTTSQTNSPNAIKQCLDSVTATGYKRIYSYDNSGRNILDAIYYCNINNVCEGSEKYEYAYDNKGNLTMWAYYTWSDVTNNWWGNMKVESEYDNSGNYTLNVYYDWDNGANDWVESDRFKHENTYSNGNLILGFTYFWDNETNNWVLYIKREIEYDNNGYQTLYVGYFWNNETNDWRKSDKQETTYDNNGNRTMYALYFWNGSNDWRGELKNEYTYDNNNNRVLYIYYNWDEENNDWIVYFKYRYENTYDNNGNLTTVISQLNDEMFSVKWESTYDSNGNQTSVSYYRKNSVTNEWEEWEKQEYIFDLSYSETDLVSRPDIIAVPFLFSEPLIPFVSVNMLTEQKIYQWDDGNLVVEASFTYHWSPKNITGISDITKDYSSIRVYPNPTTGQLRIENYETGIKSVELFDVYGRKLLSHTANLTPQTSLNISHLPAGVYFVKVSTETGEVTRKVLKE